ncbi:MAG TPA: cysteine--tRNA ligase, partial [Acidimicrobiales bacterium]|nr:cysteine--tRNA ligase [Acidimicrobiales bacterium]
MSKSLGNLVFVGELLKEHEGVAIRIALLSQHYRTTWEWRPELLDEAGARLAAWRRAGPGEGAIDAVRRCLDDDLDTPGALRALDEAARSGEGIAGTAAALLGVDVAPR